MYAFIAAFSVKILILSVLAPILVIGLLRGQITRFIADRAPQVDPLATASVDRQLRLCRALGLGTAVLGLVLLAATLRYMQRPDWDDGPLTPILGAYGIIQGLPLFLAFVVGGRFHQVLKRGLPNGKRRALLERRRLFDFISPFTIALALVAYGLYFVVLLYVGQRPFPGFAGVLANMGFITALYLLMGAAIHVTLRKMAASPLQGREDRIRSVGTVVTVFAYLCISYPVSLSLSFALKMLDMERLAPATQSVHELLFALLFFLALRAQTRIPDVERHPTAALAH